MKQYINLQDSPLDLGIAAEVVLQRVEKQCKQAVYVAARKQLARLNQLRQQLLGQLAQAKREASAGLFAWIKGCRKVSRIKHQLRDLRSRIVSWVNSLYQHVCK
jgi:hypothetical protein